MILIIKLFFIESADFIVSKALLKVMLQFDEFEKKWSSQRCKEFVVLYEEYMKS